MDQRKVTSVVKDGEEFVTIGNAAKQIKRTPQTIKHWYEWAKENNHTHELPEMYRFGSKGTRYFAQKDVKKLIKFRDAVSYGMMSDYNIKRWGKRGEEIQERKS